ncbi:Serine/threonine-protein kinase ATG1c [Vitis vinifera]|uniref:Serine/threonine-protein kinase ATG1c n=1 Tax=Vitis vinifera TaxID=29760 RepID=A0A438G630_VITVI|nr:Serine/threonine-protein kinase ATG1c [Vitis vinifera]
MFQFFFGGSLQPRGIAETLCGSPLYMALEIMQLQKYDANQLLQNIVKYSELHIPPDNNDLSADCKDLCQKLLHCNPVESLTFEEFFNHPFLSQKQPDEALSSRRSSRIIDGFPLSECNPVRKTEASSQEDSMSFPLDDDSSGAEGSPSFLRKRSSMKSTYGFSLDKKVDIRETIFNSPNNMDLASKYSGASHKPEITGFRINSLRPSDENVKEPLKSMEQRPIPPMDVSSSSAIASKPSHSQCKLGSAPLTSVNMKTKSSAPMPIAGAGMTNTCYTGSLESHSSAPFGTSQGSMDIGDALEQPSTHCMTRIKSLQQCASVITELKTGSSGFDGIFGYGRFKKWDQLGGQLMLQVLRIMKNYARQLNACLDLKVCLTTRNAQVGKWCMWIMRMMYFLLGMILGIRHISNAYQCSSASEFVGCVRCIRILSPSEVQQMSEEGMHLLNSTTIEGINDSVKRGSSSILATLGVHSLKPGLDNLGAKIQMALA